MAQRSTEFPRDGEGRVFHVGSKLGEIANRIILVGDPARAQLIANFFDAPAKNYMHTSSRGFTFHTGTKSGVPVSVVAIGMGFPNMDFAVRELRACVTGKMVMVRLGSCGSPHKDCPPGSAVIADKCFRLDQNCEALYEPETSPLDVRKYYTWSKPIEADPKLTKLLEEGMKKFNSESPVKLGMTASCDVFYSSQGRVDPHFDDRCDGLIEELMKEHPDLMAIEMESFYLLHLAKISKGSIVATASAFVMMQRASKEFLTNDKKERLEKLLGQGCIEAVVNYQLTPEETMDDPICVWKQH